MMSLKFSVDIILLAALRHWGRLSLNRNEYQEYFLGGKVGRCVGLTTLPPTCADCHEIWEPEPPGTPQGLSRPVVGIAVPITINCDKVGGLCSGILRTVAR